MIVQCLMQVVVWNLVLVRVWQVRLQKIAADLDLEEEVWIYIYTCYSI